jgi:CheY-like chemotaxis protein
VPKRSILVVDDNAANLKLVKVLLTIEGYHVMIAADADEAMKLLEKSQPELILMDIQLPGIDGLELTRRLKADERFRDIIIVALTAYAMKGDEEKVIASGADGYLSKPIDTRTLPQVVERYLREKPAP